MTIYNKQQQDEKELFDDTNISDHLEKDISMEIKVDYSQPLHVLNGINNQEMMTMLMKDPEFQSQVLNLVNNALNRTVIPTSQNYGIMSESSPIGEDIEPGCNSEVKVDSDQSQVVMLTSNLPQSRPTYAMNTVPITKPTSPSHEMSVAVPREHVFENSSLKHESPVSVRNAEDITITEESANTEYTDQEQTVSSNNMTLSAAEINLCKKAPAYPNITEPESKICSEQSEFPLVDSNSANNPDFYTFCDKMNSPDYTFCESLNVGLDDCFENNIVQPSCSPNSLSASPEYAISPKASSPEWNHGGDTQVNITSPSTNSICEDSDVENDAIEDWNNILQNLLSVYCGEVDALSPSTTVSSVYDMDESSYMDIQNIYDNTDQYNALSPNSFNDASSMVSAMSPSALSCVVDYIDDANLMDDDISSAELPGADAVQLHFPENIPSENKQLVPLYDLNLASPSSTVSSIYDVVESNVFNDSKEFDNFSESDVCAESPSSTVSTNDHALGSQLLPNILTVSHRLHKRNIVSHGSESTKQIDCDDYDRCPKKRQKVDGSFRSEVIVLDEDSDTPSLPEAQTQVKNENISSSIVCNELAHQEDCKSVVKNHPVFRKDIDGDLPLHIAVIKEEPASTKTIIDIMNGRQLDTLNKKQQTPLLLACYLENIPIISMLLKAGANPEMVDADGNNMMHIGCDKGSTAILDLLNEYYMKAPCKIVNMMDICNHEGLTPLHIASKNKDMNIINYLIQLNCNLDVKDMKTGTSVLIYALKDSDWELARHFIAHGAGVNVPTNAGMYPLDYVGISDNLELAKDLILRNAASGVKTEFTNNEMKGLFESELRKRRRKRNRDTRRD